MFKIFYTTLTSTFLSQISVLLPICSVLGRIFGLGGLGFGLGFIQINWGNSVTFQVTRNDILIPCLASHDSIRVDRLS